MSVNHPRGDLLTAVPSAKGSGDKLATNVANSPRPGCATALRFPLALSKLPTEIRDQLTTDGKIESRLRCLEAINPAIDTTPASACRLGWLQGFIEQDRAARREIRRLERLIDD